MEYSPTGIKVGGTSDTILIFGVLAVAGVILWKSGIFGTAKAATGLANDAVNGVDNIVKDVFALPSNIVTLLTDVPAVNSAFYSLIHPITVESIFNDAIKHQGKAMDGLTARTMTMIYSVDKRYTGVNYANWSAMAIVNGAKFSSTGTITSDNTLSKGLSQLEPVAED
jgi:hypothetical protein